MGHGPDMKLKRIEARNILSFGKNGLVLDNLGSETIIVGPNSSGKTNILRIIRFVLNAFSNSVPHPEFIRHDGREPEPFVKLSVILNDEEADAFATWMVIKAKSDRLDLRLQPKINFNEAQRLIGLLLDELKPTFKIIGSGVVEFVVQGTGNPFAPYDTYLVIQACDKAPSLFARIDGSLSSSSNTGLGGSRLDLQHAILEELTKVFPRSVELEPDLVRISAEEFRAVAEKLKPEWFFEKIRDRATSPTIMNVGGFDLRTYESQLKGRPSDARSLRRFLTQRGGSSESSAGLVQFFTLVFLSSLGVLEDCRLAVGEPELPDPGSLNVGHTILDGSDIAAVLYYLKNSEDSGERATYLEIQKAFTIATCGVTFDAVLATYVSNHGASGVPNSAWIRSTRSSLGATQGQGDQKWISIPSIRFRTNGFEFSSDSAASGLRQVMTILCLVCSARDCLLFLDELETNLHPGKQREILSTLLEEAHKRSNQLIIVTHSPYLIDPRLVPDIVRIAVCSGESAVFRPPQISESYRQDMARKFERTPRILAALFADKVVLVEGEAEEAALPVWIEKRLGRGSLARKNIEFISVGGYGGFKPLADVLQAWGVPFRMVSDAKSTDYISAFDAGGYAYQRDDFSNIIEEECLEAYEEALRNIGARSGSKAVAIAREVALQTDPPPTVQLIYEFLRRWLDDH